CTADIAQNGEQPRLDRSAAEAVEVAEGTQVTFLRRIFGIRRVAKQISRKRIDVIEIWKRGGTKAPRFAVVFARGNHVAIRSVNVHGHGGEALPVAASTTIDPVMCGCKEQKYVYVPGDVNVKAYLSSLSSGFDLNASVVDVTVCGMSSSLIQVTRVPAFTCNSCGPKVKLPILTVVSAARAAVPALKARKATTAVAAAPRARAPDIFMVMFPILPDQLWSGVSTIASRCSFCLKVTLAMPSMARSRSAGTFIGPGDGALPGAGCGNAVERAVWKVMLPSTFCMIW